jgi:hypothetical protein
MVANNLKNVETGQKIEKMIHAGLPGNIRGQKNVVDWIINNWQKY